MAEFAGDIPKRAVFRAAEVCEIAGLKAFVLRSWEGEFPDLGVVRSPGAARLYGRADVERVLQIKQLVFGEGLTLAGARRRLDEERARAGPPEALDAEPIEAVFGYEARERLKRVRHGLQSILDLLAAPRTPAVPTDFALTEPAGEVAVASGARGRASTGGKRKRVEAAASVS